MLETQVLEVYLNLRFSILTRFEPILNQFKYESRTKFDRKYNEYKYARYLV